MVTLQLNLIMNWKQSCSKKILPPIDNNINMVKIYYKNQMNPSCKIAEKILKNIIKNNTLCSDDN